MRTVKAWKERVVIPTYEVGKPEIYPVFLEKRVYQASSGAVYPNPVIEKISDTKVDKEWDAIFIENDYIKIMVLPALGGRIQMAYDKVRERHFVYHNHVIKPNDGGMHVVKPIVVKILVNGKRKRRTQAHNGPKSIGSSS